MIARPRSRRRICSMIGSFRRRANAIEADLFEIQAEAFRWRLKLHLQPSASREGGRQRSRDLPPIDYTPQFANWPTPSWA